MFLTYLFLIIKETEIANYPADNPPNIRAENIDKLKTPNTLFKWIADHHFKANSSKCER